VIQSLILQVRRLTLILGFCVFFVQQATAEQENVAQPYDPFESWNRPIFSFNKQLDRFLLKPVAQGYDWVTPKVVQTSVTSFFEHLKLLNTAVNETLQGKPKDSVKTLGRFGVNTLWGIGGLFDAATAWGLEKREEDFGQTLAVWGLGQGPYLVLPFLGPSSATDLLGKFPDHVVDPRNYPDSVRVKNSLTVVDLIQFRAALLPLESAIQQGDEYLFVRDYYWQNRHFLIQDGAVEDTFLDEE
jgi:phospholipid-binding lipoprotein MlaA